MGHVVGYMGIWVPILSIISKSQPLISAKERIS